MQRLFHFAFLGLIGLSLTVQTLRFYAGMSGHTAGLLQQAVEHGGLFIWLGTSAAFFKLLISLIRSVRQGEVPLLALGYGAILAWPLLLGLGNPTSNVSSRVEAVELQPEVPSSREFLAGEAWARKNTPIQGSECQGSTEFRRGCFIRLLQARKEQEAAGQAWAEQNRPKRISQCQGNTAHVVLGCLKWLHGQPGAQSGWPFGATTTAECRIEVNANYEAAHQLYLTDGNPHGAEANRRRHWLPDLKQCDLIDRRTQDPMMAVAYARLDALVRKMQQGARPTDEEHATFQRDYTEVAQVPDQPYKEAYFRLAADYLERRAGNVEEVRPPQNPQASCGEYTAMMEDMRKLDASRVKEMRRLKSPDGFVADGKRHDELNRQRIDMLWKWKNVSDGAKAMGCAAPE